MLRAALDRDIEHEGLSDLPNTYDRDPFGNLGQGISAGFLI